MFLKYYSKWNFLSHATPLYKPLFGQSVRQSVRNKTFKGFLKRFLCLNGRKETLWSKQPLQMSFWKKMFVCLSAWLFFESADARDLGLMTLFSHNLKLLYVLKIFLILAPFNHFSSSSSFGLFSLFLQFWVWLIHIFTLDRKDWN